MQFHKPLFISNQAKKFHVWAHSVSKWTPWQLAREHILTRMHMTLWGALQRAGRGVHHWRQGYLCCFGSPCQMPFVGASPSSTLWMLWRTLFHVHADTCTHTDTHIGIGLECVHAKACGLGHLHAHTYCTSSQRPTHAQANPHHPWVMNNICLSIPPSLPLAWLLASSWLHCHNVILSASLSPITKMCSDNQPFFFPNTVRFPSHPTRSRGCSLHTGRMK